MRRLLLPAACMAAVLAAGCGMEAVDTRRQARAESGHEDYPLQIAQGKWVCANLVTVNNQKFDAKNMALGRHDIEDPYGPFVSCNTPLEQAEGNCPTCNQAFRTSGEIDLESGAVDSSEIAIMAGRVNLAEGTVRSTKIAIMAAPRLECPHCKELIDPTAVMIRGGNKDATLGPNNCPKCKKYFTVTASDLPTVIDNPEEIICPSCKSPVDPMMNQCVNGSCKLVQAGLAVRNVRSFTGPCWRCGGTSLCPECTGTGMRASAVPAQFTPPNTCWYCTPKKADVGTGRCPECDDDGFTTYHGALPPTYAAWKRTADGNQVNMNRKWQLKKSAPAAGAQPAAEGQGR